MSSTRKTATVTVIAKKKIGRYQPNDEIVTDKYTARTLVAYDKARFKSEEDEFRRPHPTARKKRTRREYQRRDMQAEQ
jgi:hypothetical protein